jgi:mono/diheme cytochrome c family protein
VTVTRGSRLTLGLLACLLGTVCRRDVPTPGPHVAARPCPPDPRVLAAGGPGLESVPAALRLGGALIDREDCRQCHRILGEGGRRGPELAGLAGRRDRAWLVGHFREPKAFTPASRMPSFRELPQPELEAMADYLLALP